MYKNVTNFSYFSFCNKIKKGNEGKLVKKPYYFIAVGGIGMSGLAKYLLEAGETVLGSDIQNSKYTKKLEEMGAKIFIGHDEKNLPQDATVVVSTAIKEDNPELKKAKELGLKIYHRSDLLAEISNGKKECFIGFSGTHGKTTTSGLASYVLSKSNLHPSFVVGGIVPELNTNALSDGEKYFVAELDESDGTILKYTPEICVVNNLETDHTDFYTNGLESLLNTFETFLNNLKPNAKVLINDDNAGNKELMKRYKNVITFGLSDANYVAKNIKYGEFTTFDIYKNGEFLTDLKLCVSGEHNVYNSLGVLAALSEAGEDLEKVKPHFATFTGMGRRLQKSAQLDDITVYDDYAHHPTEIKATLSTLKLMGYKNIVAVFQPHRYSRLQALWNEFLHAFDDADKVYVTDIYAASEKPIDGVKAENFAQELLTFVPCEHLGGKIDEVASQLLPKLEKDCVIVGLGAGTITTLGKDLLNAKNGVAV